MSQKTDAPGINPRVLLEELDRIGYFIGPIIKGSLTPLSTGLATNTRTVIAQGGESMCREIFGDDFKNLVPTAVVGVIPVDRLPSLNQHQSRVRTRSVRQG